MKLRKINFKNHPILKDLQVSLEDEKGEIVNTVIFIGDNGSGKTSILRGILENFQSSKVEKFLKGTDLDSLELSFGKELLKTIPDNALSEYSVIYWGIKNSVFAIDESDQDATSIGKIVFMPTEINFSMATAIDTRKEIPDQFINIIDQKIANDISSFVATAIETEVFKNEDVAVKESMKKVCDEINSIFQCMDLEIELVGLSKDEKKQPIFKNHNNDTFAIEDLSSGEKQLFIRALSLKFLNINDSIILIDEPEISLHPQWQRKIISVYESIGRNNQLIIATHSPHVIGNIRKEQLRVLHRDHNGIQIVPTEEVERTYGQTIESILTHNMGLESVRNEELQFKIEQIQKLLRNENALENKEFQELLIDISEHLDDSDVEMALINAQIKRMKMRGTRNVEQ
ncbi:MAG: AAA family ATPase [Eubacteriales bacterium]